MRLTQRGVSAMRSEAASKKSTHCSGRVSWRTVRATAGGSVSGVSARAARRKASASMALGSKTAGCAASEK